MIPRAAPAIVREVWVPADAATTWTGLTDFATMPEWFVGVRRVVVNARDPQAPIGRTVVIAAGQRYEERLSTWEPSRRFSYVVVRPPWLFRAYEADIELEPIQAGGVTIRWSIRYAVRFGWAGRVVERAIVRPSLSAILAVSLGRFRRRIVTERVAGCDERTLT